jgi:DNA-binding CsgD family transcriptional regulator
VRGASVLTDTLVSPEHKIGEPAKDGETAVKMARDIGWRSGEAFALAMLSFCLGGQGEYGRALEAAGRSLEISEEITDYPWMFLAQYALGTLYLDLLETPRAQRHLERALALARGMSSLYWMRNAAGSLVSCYVLQGDDGSAEEVLQEALRVPFREGDGFGGDGEPFTTGQRMCICARIEMALAGGESEEALRLAGQLIESAPNMEDGQVIARLSKLRGEALAALGRRAEAEESLLAAADAGLVLGARPLLWRIHLALGNVYSADSRSDEARAEYSKAEALIKELGDNLPDEALKEGFLQRALLKLPSTHSAGTRRAARQSIGGLTARESEVAALISAGKSNREIADLLVVGERTVETHVGNVLSKLGFTSRAQIAAWAVEKGLAKTTSG